MDFIMLQLLLINSIQVVGLYLRLLMLPNFFVLLSIARLFKKKADVELGLKFCEWRMSQGHFIQDWSFAYELRDELLRLHQFEYR